MFSKAKIVSSFLCAVAGSKSAHFHLDIVAGQENQSPRVEFSFLFVCCMGSSLVSSLHSHSSQGCGQ